MDALARFLDARRGNAVLIAVLGLILPLVMIFTAAVGAFEALRRGLLVALQVIALAIIAVALTVTVLGGNPLALVLSSIGIVALAMALAAILRTGGSLSLTVLSGLVISLGMMAIFWVAVGDPVSFWQELWVDAIGYFEERGVWSAAEREQLADVDLTAMTGNVFGWLLLFSLLALFLGRSWQARIENPGGFRREFGRMRLGSALAGLSALVFFVAGFSLWPVLLNVAAVLMMVWLVQGFAVLHGLFAITGWSGAILAAIYVLTLWAYMVASPLAITVPFLGVASEFYDVRAAARRRIGSRG